jgi:hypothetical protein
MIMLTANHLVKVRLTMIDYFERYKTFDEFAKHYKLLRFRFLGINLSESVPRRTVFHQFQTSWLKLKVVLGLQVNYFDLRASLEPEDKKRGDMAFITHYLRDKDCRHSLYETFRYCMTRIRYMPELAQINSQLMTPIADRYSLRWGYLLDVKPSVVDLIHGTSPDNAFYGLENIL